MSSREFSAKYSHYSTGTAASASTKAGQTNGLGQIFLKTNFTANFKTQVAPPALTRRQHQVTAITPASSEAPGIWVGVKIYTLLPRDAQKEPRVACRRRV